MRGSDHIIIGSGTAAIACWGLRSAGVPLDAQSIALIAFAAGAGSLAPDLDHPYSKASFGIPVLLLTCGGVFLISAYVQEHLRGPQLINLSSFGPAYFQVAWFSVGLAVALLTLSLVFSAIFEHRGPVHSVVFGAAASIVFAAVIVLVRAPLLLVPAFAWGWITHLLADSLTPMGVPRWLWPFDTSHEVSEQSVAQNSSVATVASPGLIRHDFDYHEAGTAIIEPTQQVAKKAEPVPVCLKCGVPMVVRTARRGVNAGNNFYGCVNYPRCRQTHQFNQ